LFAVLFVWGSLIRAFPVFREAGWSLLLYVNEFPLSSTALEVNAEVCEIAINNFGA